MNRPVHAFFIGGPWDGQQRRIEYVDSICVALPGAASAALLVDHPALVDSADSVGLYERDQRYVHPVYLYRGTKKEVAEQAKADRKRRLLRAFNASWGAQYLHDRPGYLMFEDDMREVRGLVVKSLT